MTAKRINHELGWHMPDFSDFELELRIDFEPFEKKLKKRTITVRPVFSWKRARKVITINGRSSIGPTTEAQNWARAAAARLREQWERVFSVPLPADIELNAAIVSYLPNKRLTDASNLYQGPEDVMQVCRKGCKDSCKMHAGILVDDSVIRSHNGSDRKIDPTHSRVEIRLTPYQRGRPRQLKQAEIGF